MRSVRYTFAFLFVVTSVRAQMQPEVLPPPSFGIFGDFNSNHHSADFRTLPNVPNCCPRFETGSGSGATAGIFYGLPLARNFFLDLRGGYQSLGATLTKQESTLIANAGDSAIAIFEHSVAATIGTIAIEPLLGYTPFAGLSLRLGLNAGVVASKTYSQKEVLVQPQSHGTFENGRRTRNEHSGTIPDAAALMLGAVGGVSYALPLNASGTLSANPEVLYSYGLTPIVAGMNWYARSLRFGIGIHYTPTPEQPAAIAAEEVPTKLVLISEGTPSEVEEEAKAIVAPPKALRASLTVSAFSPRTGERPLRSVNIEEFITTQMHPLLNYIFFDQNSSALPMKYRRLKRSEAAKFRVDQLFDRHTLELYHDVLNIVGRRMLENPKAKLTLTGCNDNTGPELNNQVLSIERAEAVRDYLLDVWKIEPERLISVARNLPENPSNSLDSDGIAENRRVELSSDSWEVMQPLLVTDTLREPNPSIIRMKPDVVAEAGVSSWTASALQSGQLVHRVDGTGPVPTVIDWKLNDEHGALLKTLNLIEYSFSVVDSAGKPISVRANPIPVEQITLARKRAEHRRDTSIARYSLILFDFDKAELTKSNQRIASFVKQRIVPGADVEIVGFTDRSGNEEYNRQLSAARAEATKTAINAKNAAVHGVGKAELLYDNTLPEGRFYCRTVTITVTTPTK